jgi:enterochelin esterase-like enzyme
MLTRDPIALIKRATLTNPPLMWLDAGDHDSWRPSAESLHQALLDKGWAHEWHLYAGEHDGWYWGAHLWDYLRFYWAAFQHGGVQVTTTRA